MMGPFVDGGGWIFVPGRGWIFVPPWRGPLTDHVDGELQAPAPRDAGLLRRPPETQVVHHSVPLPRELPPDVKEIDGYRKSFNAGCGFALNLVRQEVYVLLHDDFRGDSLEPLLNSDDALIGHLWSTGGFRWKLYSESLGNHRYGLRLITASGKTIGAGRAWRSETTEPLQFTASALYPGIRNRANVSFEVGGKVNSKGEAEVSAKVSISC